MSIRAAAVLAFVVLARAQSPQPAATWSAIVADWEAFERVEDPYTAGGEGDREALTRLPEITPAADARRVAALKTFLARLDEIDTRTLTPNDAFNHAFLARLVRERIEAAAFDPARLAFINEGGETANLAYTARTTPVATRADADAWLSRLQATPRLIAENIANARRGLATGFTQPRSVVEGAIAIAKAEVALAAHDDPLLIPVAALPASISAADAATLRARARAIVEGPIASARRDWLRMLESEYLPKARPGLGIATIAQGRAYYAFLARSYTTTAMRPDEIHEIGVREVSRIRAEMQKEMKAADFQGSFPTFLHWLRTDARFYAQTRQELLEKASEIAKRADGQLPKLFRLSLPRLPYDVREVPREIEDQYTTGRYFQGSMQNGVAGAYLVNTGKLDQRPLYELPALTVHEAVPGHHLQIAIAQELADQPWFRRNTYVTAFGEGWGLYAEFLGIEMGIYRDPYERFGKLSYEMWRACRLVADTGIHWKGWTIEQARACFTDNSALAPHNIETELQRYISWPGQALAYKIGELKFKELRARAEKALGHRFDVREFHDTVLLGGGLPLDMLEQRVDAWIAAQTAARAPTAQNHALTLSAPIEHLDFVAREPMMVEHPDGSLFVTGYADRVPRLWRSRDGGASWRRVDVGTEAAGAVGNSDVDLALAPDGTLYFVAMSYDRVKFEGTQIAVGASRDAGATWTWTRLSKTRYDDRPWVEVAPDGAAHVIWNDGSGVAHAVSRDAGRTWQEQPRIYRQGGSSHLAIGPAGEIAVRVTPLSASANIKHAGADLIAVSDNGGARWAVRPAPGQRAFTFPMPENDPLPRWVEPLAWDARGALYSLWTDPAGLWLARSTDRGGSWTTWRIAEGGELRYYPYLVARGHGELAASWFSGRGEGIQLHVARIDASGTGMPRMTEAAPFSPDSWRWGEKPGAPRNRDTAGEYVPIMFLKDGRLAVVTTIQDDQRKRGGFAVRVELLPAR